MGQTRTNDDAGTSLQIELLSALIDRLGPLGLAVEPASGRMRVVIDALGGAQTLGTVGTVTTVGSVTAVADITKIGTNSAAYDQIAQMQSMFNGLRGRIAVS